MERLTTAPRVGASDPHAGWTGSVLAAQRGDADAFARLVAGHVGLVRAVCAGRFGLTREADDLAQETFLGAYRNLATLRDPQRFDSWLASIAANACKTHLARSKRGPAVVDPGALPEPPANDGAADPAARRRERMLAALQRLPEIYRETVLLFYFERRSYEEMGRALGIGQAAVNARLTKARRMLRERLGDEEANDAVR